MDDEEQVHGEFGDDSDINEDLAGAEDFRFSEEYEDEDPDKDH